MTDGCMHGSQSQFTNGAHKKEVNFIPYQPTYLTNHVRPYKSYNFRQ